MHRTVGQLARFGAVGAGNTALSFVAYALAVRSGVRYLPAGAGAFALGAVNGFVLNRAWTFHHGGRALAAGWRYAVVQLAGLLETVALLWFAVRVLGIGRLPGQVAAAVPVTLLSFALSRLWVFRTAAGPAPRTPDPAASPDPPAPPSPAVPRRLRPGWVARGRVLDPLRSRGGPGGR
jgi:putative flippase GtrA